MGHPLYRARASDSEMKRPELGGPSSSALLWFLIAVLVLTILMLMLVWTDASVF